MSCLNLFSLSVLPEEGGEQLGVSLAVSQGYSTTMYYCANGGMQKSQLSLHEECPLSVEITQEDHPEARVRTPEPHACESASYQSLVV